MWSGFEALSENYLVPGGKPLLSYLMRIRERYPAGDARGVALDRQHASRWTATICDSSRRSRRAIEPEWISDHLCWTGVGGAATLHDLLPLPYTEEALAHVVRAGAYGAGRARAPHLLENVSSYVSLRDSRITEWEFLREVADAAPIA